jgi:ribose-phosphate pyrophosphokinase
MAETLNLVNPKDPTSCGFDISKFPDGQQSIRIVEKGTNTFQRLSKQTNITIKSRLNTFQDLELIICANQALKEIGVKSIKLYIPYCIGGRSDRKFQEGGVNYIKKVIAPIINSQNFDEVRIMDPHSDVLEACIDNFKKEDNSKIINFAVEDILSDQWRKLTGDVSYTYWVNHMWSKRPTIAIVSPDAGALKKIYDVAKMIKVSNVTTAGKVREIETGKIVKTELPTMDLDGIKQIIIIDDICDGGRTFIDLAKEIKKQTDKPIYLIVTHGIFSAGYSQLGEYFEKIYTTNSIKEIGDRDYHALENIQTKVKQLNIF